MPVVASQVEVTVNHLTELLDFRGRGSYSAPHNRTDRTPDRMRGHHRRIRRRTQDGRGWAAESRFLRFAAPGRGSLERRTPPEPQPGAFSFAGTFYAPLSQRERSVLIAAKSSGPRRP